MFLDEPYDIQWKRVVTKSVTKLSQIRHTLDHFLYSKFLNSIFSFESKIFKVGHLKTQFKCSRYGRKLLLWTSGIIFCVFAFRLENDSKIKSRENVRQNIGFGWVIFVKYAIFKWSTCYRYQSEITCWDKNELMPRMVYVGVFTYDLEWNTYRGIDDQNCIFEHIVFCVCNITGVNLIRWTRYLIRLSLH